MTISDLEGRKLAIWGLGAEGRASYRYLRRHFADKPLILINREPLESLPDPLPEDPLITFLPESGLDRHFADMDLVIKAPGVSLYHPLVAALKAHDITVTSATNLWFARPRQAKTIAVTGSNGKSTTCALLSHIMNESGLRTELGGNIGRPLLSLPDDADYYVIELSSYQTADLAFAPDIAVLLNLFPEHIQWHRSHEQYYRDKCRLMTLGAGTVILNHDDALTRKRLADVPAGAVRFNDPAAIHARGAGIYQGDKLIGDGGRMLLPGAHNRQNLCAALTVCHALGLDLKACFEHALRFGGLPHRLEHLGERRGIGYVNDSISTTPEATLAALKSFPGQPITLIAGGQDRQQDYGALRRYITAHPAIQVIAAYETGPRMIRGLDDRQATLVRDLEAAVAKAQAITSRGGLILLSPAAPSYDGFRDFQQRGESFRALATA